MGRHSSAAVTAAVALSVCLLLLSPSSMAANPPGLQTGSHGQTILFSRNRTLYWYETNPGDFNEDGIVDIMDLTPLGLHYGETHPLGEFFVADVLATVDGDANGEINSADITVIGRNFGKSALGGYRVYVSSNPDDYPLHGNGQNGAGARLLGNGEFQDPTTIGGDRMRHYMSFNVPVTEQKEDNMFWVRPVDENGNEGIASTIVRLDPGSVPFGMENQPDLKFDQAAGKLEWHHQLIGDFDQNGEVSISDLIPTGLFLTSQAPFAFESVESVIDGNLDGQINEADHVVIAHYLGRRIDQYTVYRSLTLDDYPQTPGSPNGTGAEKIASYRNYALTWPDADFLGDIGTDRIWFEHEVTPEVDPYYYWVRPEIYQPVDAAGVASNWVLVPAAQ